MRDDVAREIMRNYLGWTPTTTGDENAAELRKAYELVDKHAEIVDRGIRLQSYAYYIAGEVMKAEGRDGEYHGRGDEFDDDRDESGEE